MQEEFIEQVYDTLNGFLIGDSAVSGVENAFFDGSYCQEKYDEVFNLKILLCERLASPDDEDIERIVGNMMDIQHELCIKMFRLGVEFCGAAVEKHIKAIVK